MRDGMLYLQIRTQAHRHSLFLTGPIFTANNALLRPRELKHQSTLITFCLILVILQIMLVQIISITHVSDISDKTESSNYGKFFCMRLYLDA